MHDPDQFHRATPHIIRWWNRLAPLPLGPRPFSLALGWITPYSGTTVARVEEERPGYVRVILDERRRDAASDRISLKNRLFDLFDFDDATGHIDFLETVAHPQTIEGTDFGLIDLRQRMPGII